MEFMPAFWQDSQNISLFVFFATNATRIAEITTLLDGLYQFLAFDNDGFRGIIFFIGRTNFEHFLELGDTALIHGGVRNEFFHGHRLNPFNDARQFGFSALVFVVIVVVLGAAIPNVSKKGTHHQDGKKELKDDEVGGKYGSQGQRDHKPEQSAQEERVVVLWKEFYKIVVPLREYRTSRLRKDHPKRCGHGESSCDEDHDDGKTIHTGWQHMWKKLEQTEDGTDVLEWPSAVGPNEEHGIVVVVCVVVCVFYKPSWV